MDAVVQPRWLVSAVVAAALLAGGTAAGVHTATSSGAPACTPLPGLVGVDGVSLACISTVIPVAWKSIGNPGASGRPSVPVHGSRVWTWTVPLPATRSGLVYSATMPFSDATLIPLDASASIDLAGCQSMDVFLARTPYETPYSGLLAAWYAGTAYSRSPPSVSGTVSGLSGQIRVAIDCYGRDRRAGGATPAGTMTLTFAELTPANSYL